MKSCPICNKVFDRPYLNGTMITSTCVGLEPYLHTLQVESWNNSINGFGTSYGTNLGLPFPLKCTVAFDDRSIVIFYINEIPTTIVFNYKDEETLVLTRKDLSSLIDYSKLPELIKSVMENSAFL